MKTITTAVAVFAVLFGWPTRAQEGASSTPPSCVPPPAGLIGWWAGEGSAEDLTWRADGVPTSIGFTRGIVGQAFQFVGQDSFVRVPSQEAFRNLAHVTLECWVWNDQMKPFRRLLTLTPDHVILGIDAGGKPFLNVHFYDLATSPTGQNSHSVTVTSSAALPANSWRHVVGTYDGQSARLYVDGQLVASEDAPGKLESRGAATEVYINFLQAGEVGGFIDEAAVYDRALTQAEVQSHYGAGASGLCKRPRFVSVRAMFPGQLRLSVRAPAGKPVTIQSSSDHVTWAELAVDPNPGGAVVYIDAEAGAVTRRFCRAVVP